jgi:hypothetical protein
VSVALLAWRCCGWKKGGMNVMRMRADEIFKKAVIAEKSFQLTP